MLFKISESILELGFHLILVFRESFLGDFQRRFYLYLEFMSLKMIGVIELSSSDEKVSAPRVRPPVVVERPSESLNDVFELLGIQVG